MDNYQYKKGECVHCGRRTDKGVAHFKCSYKAQEMLDTILKPCDVAVGCPKCGRKVWVNDEEDRVVGWAVNYCECDKEE